MTVSERYQRLLDELLKNRLTALQLDSLDHKGT